MVKKGDVLRSDALKSDEEQESFIHFPICWVEWAEMWSALGRDGKPSTDFLHFTQQRMCIGCKRQWMRKKILEFYRISNCECGDWESVAEWMLGWGKRRMVMGKMGRMWSAKQSERERFVIKYSSFGEKFQSSHSGMECWWNKFPSPFTHSFFIRIYRYTDFFIYRDTFPSEVHLAMLELHEERKKLSSSMDLLCMHKTYDI